MVVYLAKQTTRKPQNITNDELCYTAVEQIMYIIVRTLTFLSITIYLLAIFRIKAFTKNIFILSGTYYRYEFKMYTNKIFKLSSVKTKNVKLFIFNILQIT